MKDNCLISKTKKFRVHGTGPSRKELKPFYKIGTIAPDIVLLLKEYAIANLQNDLGTEQYTISKHCNFGEVFNANTNYRQLLLQHSSNEITSEVNEFNYTAWINPDIQSKMSTLCEYVNTIYRFRISIMKQHELNWHIDTDPSVICRAQICIQDNDSVFEFKTKTGIESFTMNPGDMYFINTGWMHRVVNKSTTERIVAIFGFKFEDLNPLYSSNLKINK